MASKSLHPSEILPIFNVRECSRTQSGADLRPDQVDTRETINRAALALFAHKGIRETTIRDIASTAGIAEGPLYRHYKSKEELAQMLFEEGEYAGAAELYERFREQAQQTPRSLGLGIRLARITGDRDAESSYALTLKNLYPKSDEFRRYQDNRL